MNSCFAAERYDVTPLPFIPFSGTGGEALSNNGVVVGGIANSDGSVSLAAAINDHGDILGFGETVSGKSQYFLLTPDPNGGLTPKALITTPPAGVR
jgi:hypothetical protein